MTRELRLPPRREIWSMTVGWSNLDPTPKEITDGRKGCKNFTLQIRCGVHGIPQNRPPSPRKNVVTEGKPELKIGKFPPTCATISFSPPGPVIIPQETLDLEVAVEACWVHSKVSCMEYHVAMLIRQTFYSQNTQVQFSALCSLFHLFYV